MAVRIGWGDSNEIEPNAGVRRRTARKQGSFHAASDRMSEKRNGIEGFLPSCS